MPKIVTEHERALNKESLCDSVVSLLKRKPLRKITVEDVTKYNIIGKGSFYLYFETKELLLFETLKRCENELIREFSKIKDDNNLSNKERIKKALFEIYLSPKSIILYVSPLDIDWLMRRLPSQYHEKEQQKSKNNFVTMMSFFDINPQMIDINVLTAMLETLGFAATNQNTPESAKKIVLEILVNNIAEYLSAGININNKEFL
jgi:AcrR family transcriptional regulator